MATKAKKIKSSKIGIDKAQGESKTVITRSPAPTKKVEVLNFYDALREVTLGKRITRISWEDNQTYIFMTGEFLMIHIGEKDHQLIVSRGDIEGIDWIVLPTKKEALN